MAKVKLIIEDVGDGGISLALEGTGPFPADMSKWTSAQRAAMWCYHALGTPGQDLATIETEGSA